MHLHKIQIGTETLFGKKFLLRYGYRRIFTLMLFLTLCHPQKMTGQVTPQAPATSAQPQDAAELQSLLDQHRYIEFDDKLLATDPTHLTGPQTLYFSSMLAFSLDQLDNAATRFIRALNIDKEHSLTPTQDAEALETLGQNQPKTYLLWRRGQDRRLALSDVGGQSRVKRPGDPQTDFI